MGQTGEKDYFAGNELGEFIFTRTYSKWRPEDNRRETWLETTIRFMDFMKENVGDRFSQEEYHRIHQAILNHEVMPSMRLLWSAGDMARKTHMASRNCSYVAISSFRDMAEVLYILACGTGLGFSSEKKLVEQLPPIKVQDGSHNVGMFVVEDSREGWAEALYHGLTEWSEGRDVVFDYSGLRPAGARLKTMGGRSSGPQALISLLDFVKSKILSRQGSKLKPIDVHDIVCKIGEVIVAGGVRRSALIGFSDLDEEEIRDAKKGEFWVENPQRSLSNNSAIYESKPSLEEFHTEWEALRASGTGERGIMNRGNLRATLPERRVAKGYQGPWGGNPCQEISLRSKQTCNLSSVIARSTDTEESLIEKVKIASIIGTYQSSLSNFPFVSEEWTKNEEDERLLGVSINGIWDCKLLESDELLRKMREVAIEQNRITAASLGINQSTSITCVKPEGTSSQLLDTSSGMHPRHSPYYIRRVRISSHDPLLAMLRSQGIQAKPEVGQTEESATTWVLEFPVKAPEDTIVFRDTLTAIGQLEHWKKFKVNFTEHNPSVTISVGPDEWEATRDWVWDNWDIVGGLSFLPRFDHVYQLAPYSEITKEEYDKMKAEMPKIDYSKLSEFEKEDGTEGAKSLACSSATGCEL